MEHKTAFKRWAVENGLNSVSISRETGICRRTIRSYMQGTRTPRRDKLKRLEEVYGVSTRELFPL